MAKTLFFDLFYTLVHPLDTQAQEEWAVLNMTRAQWGTLAETEEVNARRDTGALPTPEAIIQDILDHSGLPYTQAQFDTLLALRINRMRTSITQVDPVILDTLAALRAQGHRICLVSNADVIDTMHWAESPLAPLLDETIFSHQIRIRKPDPAIYQLAMTRMGATPEESWFIGDGGSDEHKGAKSAGMHTVLTRYLRAHSEDALHNILPYADTTIHDFAELKELFKT